MEFNNKKLLRLAVIIFCLYLIVTTSKAIYDLWRAGDKLTQRETRVATLKKEQENLLRQKAMAENPNFLEKIARDSLGMNRPGEQVVVIPQDLLVEPKVASEAAVPNWQKWVRLLF